MPPCPTIKTCTFPGELRGKKRELARREGYITYKQGQAKAMGYRWIGSAPGCTGFLWGRGQQAFLVKCHMWPLSHSLFFSFLKNVFICKQRKRKRERMFRPGPLAIQDYNNKNKANLKYLTDI